MNQSRRREALSIGRVLVYGLILLTCLKVWAGGPSLLPRAEAQIPDSGLQRKLLIDEAAKTNALLAEIKQILQGQTLNVRVIGADKP